MNGERERPSYVCASACVCLFGSEPIGVHVWESVSRVERECVC